MLVPTDKNFCLGELATLHSGGVSRGKVMTVAVGGTVAVSAAVDVAVCFIGFGVTLRTHGE